METGIKRVYKYIVIGWPSLFLVGFASVYSPVAAIVGYRWTGELALGAFLLTAIFTSLFSSRFLNSRPISRKELVWVILPILTFTLWSGLSIFWALSWRGALHHTLLWGCYAVFYLLIRQAINSSDWLSKSLKVASIIVFAISTASVIEYIGSLKPITMAFTTRYYLSAEAFVALLPLFIAVVIQAKAKWAIISAATVVAVWAMMLATTSRTMFTAGVAALIVFVFLDWIADRKFITHKRLVVLIGSLILVTFVFQLQLASEKTNTLADRFSGREESSVLSGKSRILMWGIAYEGFRKTPILGVGADNYFSNYGPLRESYSTRDPQNPIVEINEDLIPERAHNEYLQILSELGLVGGLLFAWLLAGIAFMFLRAIRNGASLMAIGALSGIVAFLVASLTSSYSFRFPANGICFFFLLAVAAKELLNDGSSLKLPNLRRWFFAFGIVTAISMIIFSAVRGNSIRLLANSQNTSDKEIAESEIKKAIEIDPSEPMFRFYYGQQLYIAGRYDEAIPEMRLAIDNGLANSTSYFNLLAAQMLSGKNDDAYRTFEEALRVYPRSVFLRTGFASFLKRQGDTARADAQFQKAVEIDPKQARSWQLAHDEGLERLVQRARVDDNFVTTRYLMPDSAPLALVNFQRQATGPQP